MSIPTPRTDAVLAAIGAQIDVVLSGKEGPMTMGHATMIAAWIEALGTESKRLERDLARANEEAANETPVTIDLLRELAEQKRINGIIHDEAMREKESHVEAYNRLDARHQDELANRDRLRADLHTRTIERDEARAGVEFANLACERSEAARKEAVALAARLRDIMQADRDAMKVIEADAEECKQ